MNDNYIINYSYDEISDTLKQIQECVAKGKFLLSQNHKRSENSDFIEKYNLTIPRIKDIISEIEVTDFCYGLRNKNPGYENEVLYVFCPQVELAYGHMVDAVDVYLKFNLVKSKWIVIISFHQRNYPIDYLFRES